jgi:hypothetical protein
MHFRWFDISWAFALSTVTGSGFQVEETEVLWQFAPDNLLSLAPLFQPRAKTYPLGLSCQ